MSHAPKIEGTPRRSWRGRASTAVALLCWCYAGAIVAGFLLMRLAGERWWLATLLLFSPRWLWIAPALVLAPLGAIIRRRMVLPMVLAAIIVLCGIMDFRVPWRAVLPAGDTHSTLCLFTCNLHNTQSSSAILDSCIAWAHPDVIALQDFTNLREPAIVRQEKWGHDAVEDMYIASRYPLHRVGLLLPRDAAALSYASHGWPLGQAICYQVDLPGGPVRVVNLHLASPHQALDLLRHKGRAGIVPLQQNSIQRSRESMTLRRELSQMSGPILLAGDFNTPDDSPIFQHAWADFHDAFSTAGLGFGTTYAKHHTWLRIDHVLYDPTWRCTQCRVGPDVGSGHRPLIAAFKR